MIACCFYLYFLLCFLFLIHDYTLCFTGSPYCIFSYCKFSYYDYISIWPYYIVIHSSTNVSKYKLVNVISWFRSNRSFLYIPSKHLSRICQPSRLFLEISEDLFLQQPPKSDDGPPLSIVYFCHSLQSLMMVHT